LAVVDGIKERTVAAIRAAKSFYAAADDSSLTLARVHRQDWPQQPSKRAAVAEAEVAPAAG
jgi:hypothetical protein